MAASAPGVALLETTMPSSVVSCEYTSTVVGVRATHSGKEERSYLASMVPTSENLALFQISNIYTDLPPAGDLHPWFIPWTHPPPPRLRPDKSYPAHTVP
jgi:hypothetical protein